RHHFFPWPWTMMHWHGPYLFSEVDAGYLNKTLGRPRGYYGDFQYALPKTCTLEIRGHDGKPLEGVSVELYQRQGGRDPMPGFFMDEKLAIGTTLANGRFTLPNRETPAHETVSGYKLTDNPFGKIDVAGGNGLMLARLSKDGASEYHFLRIFDFNVACLRGETGE